MAQAGPNSTIYVKNINYNTSNQALGDEFAKLGEVTSARIITSNFKGKTYSQGFGFVTFKDPAVMKQAIAKNGNITLDGRTLFIREAIPKKRDTLFIRHIPEGTTPKELQALFVAYNAVDAKIVKFDSDQFAGFGFVKFDSEENRAKALDNSRTLTLKGVNVDIKLARRPFNFRRRGFGRFRGSRRAPRARAPQQQNTAQAPAPAVPQ